MFLYHFTSGFLLSVSFFAVLVLILQRFFSDFFFSVIFFALLFSSAAFVSLPFSILTFSVFGRLAATCSALILPLVLFCVWCCCCFCLSRVFVLVFFVSGRPVGRSGGQPGIPPVNRSTAPVSRSTGHSTGQPPRSAGQPGIPPVNRSTASVSRSTGQPGRGGSTGIRSAGCPVGSAGYRHTQYTCIYNV